MIDPKMRDRVWERWLETNPWDEGATDETREAMLSTYAASAIEFRLRCEDLAHAVGDTPSGRAAIALADSMDERMRRLSESALIRALRSTR